MRSLARSDLHAILEAVQHLHAAASREEFARYAAETAERLIRTRVASVSQWSTVDGHRTYHTTRWLWTEAQREAAQALLPTHPAVVHVRDRQPTEPFTLSDLISDREWRAHPFYRQVWAPHRIFRSLHFTLALDNECMASLSLDRAGRDFSRRDRNVLQALGPHLTATWRRLDGGKSPLRRPARATAGVGEAQARWRELGLSAREAEVLHWIVGGKQNREIAGILGLSLRTVQKHVENMLARLGVENRHALTVHALYHAPVEAGRGV